MTRGVADAICLGLDDAAAATPSANTRTSILPMRKRASWAVSTGISVRSSTRGRAIVVSTSSHSLDQMGARRSGLERLAEVLGLAGHPAIQELRDPEGARADDAAHREALRVRLRDT